MKQYIILSSILCACSPDLSDLNKNSCPVSVQRIESSWIITDPEIHFDFWGDWSNANVKPYQFEQAWNELFFDGVLDRLAEYGIHNGSLDSNYSIDNGSDIFIPNDAGIVELDDSNFPKQLNEEIRLGALAYPNDNTIFVVFLAPGLNSYQMITNNWSGYHNNYSYGGQKYAYIIILFEEYNATNITVSHEIAEAATNPDNHNGFFDYLGGGEIGDLCGGSVDFIGADEIQVQKLWSQKLCSCL